MRYFYIDSENVQQYNFIEELNVGADDKIIMLVSNKSQKISIKDLERFTSCKAKIEYEPVYTGYKNAMDFQLVTNLTLTVANNNANEDSYIIVSNDNDFNLPIKYLKNKTNVDISVLKTDINTPEKHEEAINNKEVKENKGLNIDKDIIAIMRKVKDLSKLHNELKNKYGDEKGRKIYKEVKTYFKENKKSCL